MRGYIILSQKSRGQRAQSSDNRDLELKPWAIEVRDYRVGIKSNAKDLR